VTTEAPAAVRSLPIDVCLQLLARHRFGRLAFVAPDGSPAILPVDYVFDEPSLLVRDDGGKLRQVALTNVAFEVDGVDDGEGSRWSVTVRGPAFEGVASDGRPPVLKVIACAVSGRTMPSSEE
jgi:nitroimidazol reductase NimA-like FMN-containing flavoprotein (pyridoxamine 5'-phosphate oxidase superfamily)